jgi:hypothetical protein
VEVAVLQQARALPVEVIDAVGVYRGPVYASDQARLWSATPAGWQGQPARPAGPPGRYGVSTLWQSAAPVPSPLMDTLTE